MVFAFPLNDARANFSDLHDWLSIFVVSPES